MRRGVALAIGTVINIIFGGIMGYFNGGPPPPWSDLPGVLMYTAGDWASVPLLLGIMFAVYFTLLLFSRKKRDAGHVDGSGQPRLQSGEPRERNTVRVLEKTATRMWIISIQLDCGHPLLTLMTEVLGNREGLWWCSICSTGNHVERIYR